MERDALVSGLVQPGGREPAPGRLALVQAFVNTVDREHGPDLLDEREGLREWLAARGMLEPERTVADEDLAAARDVREALRSLLHANNGAPEEQGARAALEAAAAAAGLRATLPPEGPELVPSREGVEGALGPRRRRRLRGDAGRQLGPPEGVPARRVRVGVLRPIEQRERHLVLDGGVRRA